MKRIALLAACLLLCLFAVPAAHAAEGYLVQIPEDRLILANALTGELRQASGDVWLVQTERDLAALRAAGLVIDFEPNCDLTLEANSWHIEALHAADAWNHTGAGGEYDRRGTGVTVAVIDSGVEADNSDFDPDNILPYRDYGNNKNGVDIWHGTFVAGIIAAQLDNNVGIDGTAPDVKILPVTITTNGRSDAYTAIRAIEYAASRADVINLSMGGGAKSSFLERTCRNAVQGGTILVAAAGNYDTDQTPSANTITYPAGYDCVVSVSSCKRSNGEPVFDSLYSYFNKMVNVSAPGSSIRSLYLGGGTATASGTSFAAPMVSAMAAMAKQVNTAIDTDTFLALLEATCIDLGDPGRDDYYGMGFVDYRAFLEKLDEQYPIRYFSGEEPAQFDGEVPETHSLADDEITLPEPVREGWVFKGWYEDPALSGRPVTKLPAAAMGERSYYARWEAIPGEPPTVTGAPAAVEVSPASLDGLTAAVGFTAGLDSWFADPAGKALRYTLVSGPGTVEGSVYTYTPAAEDAGKEYSVTVRASNDREQSVEHRFTLRVGPLPASRSVLNSEPLALALSELPREVSASLTLYGNRVTAVRLGETALTWRMEGETLYVHVPALTEGVYDVAIDFDAGDPATWRWTVSRDYPLLAVYEDAPACAEAAPGSLDGVSSATPCRVNVANWFTVNGIDYSLVSGPGAMDGSYYIYSPTFEDAEKEYPVTVRAADTHGQSAEHSFTLRIGPLPASQSVLNTGPLELALSELPQEVSASLTLYGNRVTAVSLGEPLPWHTEGETLVVTVPILPVGEYDVSIEFDARDPVVWHWTVYRDYPLLSVRDDAPASADAAPASLDGIAPAVSCTADVADWFTVTEIDYALISGPGTLEGSVYTYTPTAADAGKSYTVTVRAADPHGQSAEHSFTIRVGAPPISQSVLNTGALELALSGLPKEVSAALTLYGNRVTAVRLGETALAWRIVGETLYVNVPALPEGDYDAAIEFDAGDPVIWHWTVIRDYPLLAVREDAPTEVSAVPASLDGLTPATPCTANVANWFTVTDTDYTLVSGPGTLDGSAYTYTPEAAGAGKEYTVTVRASDAHGQTAGHSFTIRVGALPVSQSVLNTGALELGLSDLPKEVSASLSLYGNRVTAVRLGEASLTWHMEDGTLYISVPALAEGDYDISIEFDAGDPVLWHWTVIRDYPLLSVREDAPIETSTVPASLDGLTPAVSCAADIADWFTVTGIDYALLSGPGTLEGTTYTFTPTAADAGKEYAVTVRAADLHGQTAEHTFTLRVGQLPVSRSVLTGAFALNLCDPAEEAAAELALYGNRVTAVRLGETALTWRVEDGVLYAAFPDLTEGDYEITVEFDAGEPALWPWRVYRDCPSKAFRDVPADTWYHGAVDFAVKNGLMNGVAADRFAPEAGFTRAMLVTVLHRAAGTPKAAAKAPFTDVPAGLWYAEAVDWAYETGIVNGVAPDRFAPETPITREQLVTILFRYAGDDGSRAGLDAFPDAGEISGYAREAMSWAIARGLVNGVGKGDTSYLSPRGGATRAQVAAILMRFLS